MRKLITTTLMPIALSAACGKKAADPAPDTSKPTEAADVAVAATDGKAPAPDTAPAEPPPAAAKVGLENPSNDPEVVKAVKQLLADCGAELDKSAGFTEAPNRKKAYYSCEKYAAFRDMKFANPKTAPTFVNLLEDPDPKVKAAAIAGLNTFDGAWRYDDKALAERIFTALKNEKPGSSVDFSLALMVVHDFSSSYGFGDQILALGLDPATSTDVRETLMSWWSAPQAYELIKANLNTTDPSLLNGVVQGYIHHFETHTEEACTLWANNLETPNKTVNQYALGHLTGGWTGNTTGDSESETYISGGGASRAASEKRCSPEQLDKALTLIEKNWAGDKSLMQDGVYSLGFLAKDPKSPEAIKTRSIALLKQIVETKDFWMRSTALGTLFRADPAGMKAYVQQFANDEGLKTTVEGLLKEGQQ